MAFNIEKYYLKSSSFFEFLSEKDASYVKSKVSRIEFSKGEVLFNEKGFSKGVYIIRKGKVKIFQTNGDGKSSIVYIYKKGDYFGYRPLLADEPNPVSAVAMSPVVVSFIPKDVFLRVLSTSNELTRKLLEVLSKEFSVWINKLTVFSQYTVKDRVALSLLILKRVYQTSEVSDKKVVISIFRDDFASFVGTAKETLVRMLRIFKDQNIISSKGTKIIILREDILRTMVSEM